MKKIGIIVEDIAANGGCEIVSLRLHKELSETTQCSLYNFYNCNEENIISFGLTEKFKKIRIPLKKEISLILEKLNENNENNLILQIATPTGKLFSPRLINKLSENRNVFVVIHNSPKSFTKVYTSRILTLKDFLRRCKILLFNVPFQKIRFSKLRKNKNIKFISLSKGNARELKQYFGIDSEIINNVVSIKETQIKQKTNNFVFLGRFDNYQKNITFLLDAWKKSNTKDWKLLLAGSGPDKKKLIQYINKKHIEKVEIVPFIKPDEVQDFISKQRVLLLSSNFEGFPTVFYENMAAGNVILTKKFDGFSEDLMKDGINCLVANSKKEYISKIEELINDENSLNKMSLNNIEDFKNIYNNQTVVEDWNRLINS